MEKIGLTIVLCLFLAVTAVGKEENGRISGFVLDERGNSLKGVHISVTGTEWNTVTDKRGNYTLSISAGLYLVQAAMLDIVYEPAIKWADVGAEENLTLNFVLFDDKSAAAVNCDHPDIETLIALWRRCFDQTRLSEVLDHPEINNCKNFIDILMRTLVKQWEYQSRGYAQKIDNNHFQEKPGDYARKIQESRYHYNQFKNAHWIISWLIEPPPYPIIPYPEQVCQENSLSNIIVEYLSDPDPRVKVVVIDILGSTTDSILVTPLRKSLRSPKWLAVYESMNTEYRLSPLNFDIWDAMYNYHEYHDVDFSVILKKLVETHPNEFVRRKSMAQLVESYPDVARQVRIKE